MPLPNFMKRKSDTSRTDGNANIKQQTGNEGLPKALSAFSSIKRNSNVSSNYANNNTPSKNHPDTKLRNKPLLPLDGFPDPPYHTDFDNDEKPKVFRRLCRNFDDILNSFDALDVPGLSRASTPSQPKSQVEFISLIQYFQQFLRNKAAEDDGKRAINLLQFWLDVQSFKTFCNSMSDEVNSNTEILKDQTTVSTVESSTSGRVPNCDNEIQTDVWKPNPSLKKCDNSKVQDDNRICEPTKIERDSGSVNSFDSGIVTSPTTSHASQSPRESTAQSSLELINSNPSIHIENAQDIQNQNDFKQGDVGSEKSSEYQINYNQSRKACSEMALAIYQSYIAPAAPFDIVSAQKFEDDDVNSSKTSKCNLSREHVNDIISGICPQRQSDKGETEIEPNPSSFDSSLLHVANVLETNYHNEFLQSAYYAKYQLQVLTKAYTDKGDQVDGQNNFTDKEVNVIDILKNDSMLSCFMEFMDSSPTYSPGQSLIEFWLCASNFRDVVKETLDNTKEARQDTLDDAVGIYNKFVSMEAITPLGFSSIVRSRMEDRICEEGRLDSEKNYKNNPRTCFDEALMIVETVLTQKYLQPFLSSVVFKKYLAVLQMSASSTSKKISADSSSKLYQSASRDRLRRADSSNSLNTSYSSEYGMNTSISLSNTLLADGSVVSSSAKRTGTHFLDRYNLDPNRLWKRKQYHISNIGHVDPLGRYRSCYEKMPEHGTSKSTVISHNSSAPMSARLSRAMRRLVVSEGEEKMREEMAWQNAQTIIEEIRENLNRFRNFRNTVASPATTG